MLLSVSSPKNKELSNMILISTASFISQFGTSVYNFAISLYVLKLTGSGLSFATTLVISILSTVLVNPFAGVLADRLDKKLLAVITDMLNGILLIVLYLLTISYSLNLPMIYISTFILNVFSTVYGISIEAARPNMVSQKSLISMNSISKVIDSASSILGPMVGGIIFAFLDIRFFIIINGISFVLSSLLQFFMDFKFNYIDEGESREKLSFFADIMDGINYLKTKENILDMFKIFVALNFFIGLSINVPLPYIINNVLKLSASSFGIIEAAFPVGMILGALMIKKISDKYSYQRIIKAASYSLSACMAAIGFSVIMHYQAASLYYFILIMIFTGICISCVDIPIFYILQKTIPDKFRGRVLSIAISIAKIVLPAALIIAGALVNLLPAWILPISGGILMAVIIAFII